MSLLVAVAFSVFSFAPQGSQSSPEVLTAAEQKSLHDKLADYIKAWTEYDDAQDKARDRAVKAYAKSKDAFYKDWDLKNAKKGDIMKSPADLRAIFSNCFIYEKRNALSIRKFDVKGPVPAHFLMVPPSYKAEKPSRTVLLIPGQDEAGNWVDGQRYFEATWDKSASVAEAIFHIPVFTKELDLTTMPDYGKTGAEEQEKQRNAELLGSFGETQRNYNLDRARTILDAGKGACSYALRAVTHFPGTFAGLVLRSPDASATEALRLGSLNGMPILLLSSAQTDADCNKLKERIDALTKGSCTVLMTTDAYPFKAAAPEIEKWVATVKRDVNKQHIVIEPNDDRWRSAYWVRIQTMESIFASPKDKRPRMEVTADRSTNRITVTAVGIESFTLMLNDSLVDLDKEFIVLVNDVARPQKLSRDLIRTIGFVRQRFDGDYIFPVEYTTKVPKPEASAVTGGADK